MRELLSRGIGVHHGGMLPIVKEVSAPLLLPFCQETNLAADGRNLVC